MSKCCWKIVPIDLVDVGCHKCLLKKKKKKEASLRRSVRHSAVKMSYVCTVKPILLIRKKADMTANLAGRVINFKAFVLSPQTALVSLCVTHKYNT